MSLKDKNSNDVYDVLGMSENFRKELIDNCFDKIDDLERTNYVDKDDIDKNIIKWDSQNYFDNNNKRKIYSIVKYSVAAVAICVCGLGLVAGANYFSKDSDDSYISTPLKNGKIETESQFVYKTTEKNNVEDDTEDENLDDEYSDVIAYFEESDNVSFKQDLEDNNVDSKLVDGYEKRTIVINSDKGKKEYEIIGKNFIEISPEEASDNAEFFYKNDLGYTKVKGAKKEDILKEKKAFSKKSYLYFIANAELCRLTVDADHMELWRDCEFSYTKLFKKDGKVYAVNDDKKEGSFDNTFYDANIVKPCILTLGSIEHENEGETYNMKSYSICCYYARLVETKKKVTYYYIDTNWNLWKTEYTRGINDEDKAEYVSDWGSGLQAQAADFCENDFNIDEVKDNKKLLAKNVEYDLDVRNNTKKLELIKNKKFEKVAEDDYVSYK